MNKISLSERDICTKFITPSIVAAGWRVEMQVREEGDGFLFHDKTVSSGPIETELPSRPFHRPRSSGGNTRSSGAFPTKSKP